jgi:uncharacterized membrane protein
MKVAIEFTVWHIIAACILVGGFVFVWVVMR